MPRKTNLLLSLPERILEPGNSAIKKIAGSVNVAVVMWNSTVACRHVLDLQVPHRGRFLVGNVENKTRIVAKWRHWQTWKKFSSPSRVE
jgi:hypothetical protein